jgi:hypothetical protein
MDESVALFLEEQKRLDEAGGPIRHLKRQALTYFSTMALIALTTAGVMGLLGAFPRNPDHSMKLLVLGPGLGCFALVAFLLLRFGKLRAQALRWTCWYHICLALIVVPVGLIDMLARKGG